MIANYQSQEFLFQRIKELLPPHASLVDTVANILSVSSDSAYRRIRGETPLVLDEARELCAYFKLSLDQILNVQGGAVMFQNVRISTKNYSYTKYLTDIIKQVEYATSFIHKEIIYLTKDMALFHNFYYRPLIAFRYFFWMKSIVQHPDFINKEFEFNFLSEDIESVSREMAAVYCKVPSTEIWNTECINSAISQIEFYKDSGWFATSTDIKTIYEALEESIIHLRDQVEHGCKFMPGENPESKKNNFRFFYNRIILGDNTIMVVTDKVKTTFINYDVLNYMFTRDENFCDPCYTDMKNMMKRSTLISQTSEKQRNIFFGIILGKIQERKKRL
jgi:hypothetical protein